jgi:peptidoglycan/LPS O-acetylase OafA/YrhL
MAKLAFRRDINGLRAYAVIAVVLFHFGVPGFRGGFVGVDVFFVISGFLMMAIVSSGLEAGEFSLLKFYGQRARRLLPALAALCTLLLLPGWFALSPTEYVGHARNTVGALLFVSNFMFWRESGYFDTSAHEKLLLHTWSLSLEWQFYLIFPVVLMLVWKLRPTKRSILLAICSALLASFAASVLITPFKPIPAFYLLPTRAWELFAGAATFLLMARGKVADPVARGLELCGFGLIFGAVFLFDGWTSWPSWRAAVPVLGTCLVIAARRDGSILTTNRPAQWLGTISYSLYLWHWPGRVLLGMYGLETNPAYVALTVLAVCVISHVSWKFIEVGCARLLPRLSSFKWRATVASMCAIGLGLPLVIVGAVGIPGRFPARAEAIFSEAAEPVYRSLCHDNTSQRCSIDLAQFMTKGDPARVGALVVGDSHAAVLLHSIEEALPLERPQALVVAHFACPTIKGIRQFFDIENQCGKTVDSALAIAKSLPLTTPVFIINRTAFYFHGFNESHASQEPAYYLDRRFNTRSQAYFEAIEKGIVETACEFAKTRPVFMMRPIPELGVDVPRTMGRGAMRGRDVHVSIAISEYRERTRLAVAAQDRAAMQCGVKILDPTPLFCHGERCWGDIDGQPLFRDSNHVNKRAAALLTPMFSKALSPDGESKHGGEFE